MVRAVRESRPNGEEPQESGTSTFVERQPLIEPRPPFVSRWRLRYWCFPFGNVLDDGLRLAIEEIVELYPAEGIR